MDFMLVLGLVGLVAGVAALALVIDVRVRLSRLQAALDATTAAGQQLNADVHSAHEAVHFDLDAQRRELESVQHDLERTQRELGELKAATEPLPAPPLPRGRTAGLDDLRERLRAAHTEPDATDEP